MASVAFIGLGNMGGPMAGNIAKAGHTVTGFDLSPENLAAAADRGVTGAASAAEAVQSADAVVTCLPNGPIARAVYLGEDGILANAPAGTVFMDASTIDIVSARAIHEEAEARGQLEKVRLQLIRF